MSCLKNAASSRVVSGLMSSKNSSMVKIIPIKWKRSNVVSMVSRMSTLVGVFSSLGDENSTDDNLLDILIFNGTTHAPRLFLVFISVSVLVS